MVSAMLSSEEHGGQQSCRIQNMTLDGEPMSLDQWRRGLIVGQNWVPGSDVISTSAKSHWRVPTSGIVQFDFVAFTPCFVNMERFQLDLSS